MDPVRDRRQPLGAVVAGVHRGHDRQQHLRGADVAGRLVAADVLLAGLQRQSVGSGAVGVHRHADQAAGQLAGVLGVHGQVSGVRSAESHWHAEALGGAEGDVGAELTRRGDEGQRQQVGADGDECAALVRLRDELRPVDDAPLAPGSCTMHTEEVAVGQPVRADRR